MSGLERNVGPKVDTLLGYFPIVVLLGVRQCGKTTLSRMLRPAWKYFDLERARDYDLVTRDPDFFFREHPHSIIIDEAQRHPDLFSELRGVVDRDRQHRNRFLLTGSSSLDLIKNVSESLAGRVGIVELGTFKTNELHARRLPGFYKIFEGVIGLDTPEELRDITPVVSHDQLMDAFLKGGYPEPVLENDTRFHAAWMENYVQTYIERDIRALFPRLDLIKYQRFVTMLAGLSGTIINRSQVGRSLDISEKAIRDYLQIAAGSYVWRTIPSYAKSPSKSVVKMPKGNFRDSGLTHFLQGVMTRERLLTNPHVGAAFEAFIFEEIVKGIQATEAVNWDYYYFRTKNGAEIDLVLEGPFGCLPIEIKFGSSIRPRSLQALKNFVYTNDLPLGLVINNSEAVERIADRIVQIPATCL